MPFIFISVALAAGAFMGEDGFPLAAVVVVPNGFFTPTGFLAAVVVDVNFFVLVVVVVVVLVAIVPVDVRDVFETVLAVVVVFAAVGLVGLLSASVFRSVEVTVLRGEIAGL